MEHIDDFINGLRMFLESVGFIKEGGLEEYREKREFNKTPEPEGEVDSEGQGEKPIYGVQIHDAEKAGLHRDIRFEWAGALKSFVAKQEIPVKSGEFIYVVAVEDHPRDYIEKMPAQFEIPEGYGKGRVTLETKGNVKVLEETPTHIKLEFVGGKYEGSYSLIRMGQEGKVWKLIRK